MRSAFDPPAADLPRRYYSGDPARLAGTPAGNPPGARLTENMYPTRDT